MRIVRFLSLAVLSCLLVSCCCQTDYHPAPGRPFVAPRADLKTFPGRGVVREVKRGLRTLVIQHEAISNYMAAMTMPFHVKDPADLDGLQAGDEISFRLSVSEQESWIDRLSKTGRKVPVTDRTVSTAT